MFMARLSQCIFELSSEDLKNLWIATSKDLGVEKDNPLEFQKKSLARYCHRSIRGVEKIGTHPGILWILSVYRCWLW